MAREDERRELLREKQRASDERNGIDLDEQRRKRQEEIARINAQTSRRSEIKSQIEYEKAELEILKEKIEQYNKLEGQISEAIQKSRSGLLNIMKSRSELERAYTGQSANNQIVKLESVIEQLEKLILKLSNTIMPEIRSCVEKIKNEIMDKEYRIRCLNYDLTLV